MLTDFMLCSTRIAEDLHHNHNWNSETPLLCLSTPKVQAGSEESGVDTTVEDKPTAALSLNDPEMKDNAAEERPVEQTQDEAMPTEIPVVEKQPEDVGRKDSLTEFLDMGELPTYEHKVIDWAYQPSAQDPRIKVMPDTMDFPRRRSERAMVEIIPEVMDAPTEEPPMIEIISEFSNITKSFQDKSEPIIEVITRPSVNLARRATQNAQAFQPLLRVDTSVVPAVGPFTSPTYESPSQRRRRERRTSCMNHVVPNATIVAGSTISIDVVESPVANTPRGRRSRRRVSPDRRRDGEIQIIDESDDDDDGFVDFRGRQKKRPSELRCFAGSSFGPKRAYPAQTPVEPAGGAQGVDFRRLPLSPGVKKRVSDWIGENARVVEFVSTPISPVPEVWGV